MLSSQPESKTHEFTLQYGLFGQPKKITITPEFIEFNGARVDQNTFIDVKYFTESIVWYKFHIGTHFRIDFKYEDSKKLSLVFSKYTWRNRHYGQVYSDFSKYVGNYFLIKKINRTLEHFDETGRIELSGLKIDKDQVAFDFPHHIIPWSNVGLKEYPNYFVVFDKMNANKHKRITFDEWNAELLFNVLKSLIQSLEL